ncbi:MAG: hypothetical protein GY708_26890, partial [Actinomycetia bacterium]|nr:hypothetical protein [Actinomycetes bacterium]
MNSGEISGDRLPASVADLDVAETIGSDWDNTTHPWSDDEVSDTLTVGAQGSVDDNALSATVTKLGQTIENVEVADDLTISATGQVADGALSSQVAHLDAAETIGADWDNTTNPWSDDEVSDTLTVGVAGSVADDALSANVVLKDVTNTFTSSTESPILIQPAVAPAVDTILLDMKDTAGASNFSVDAEGDVTATSFSGDGSGLTSLNAGELNSGEISGDRLPSSVADLDVPETVSANWDNTANPWSDAEVSDTLTVGAESTVADEA